ncbi:hypothetical protein QMK19_23675 [Streptomyces sp. H10-C2]|uniref:DUF6542 domain-containing protein n=1 Tax=unclassified Streptomyces TaxID=2593676 RepID=UPI0024BA6A8E|nr:MULTISPECIES: DUF6542 domain-containing protein [unclassified Streptomyces]MDJ0342710.1 hypothetical protein [Streptomyces sp. PH10-H1]MDJ0372581.1 hypothetical protein [Streptomyces sp. H10-C2]
MEQHSARTRTKNGTNNGNRNGTGNGSRNGTAPGRPRLPRPARPVGTAESPAVSRAPGRGQAAALLPRLVALARSVRLPQAQPRLTGLGTGLLTTVVAALGGALDSLLFDGPGVFFGLVFVAVCIAAGLYVRPYDLVAAPVAAPIAFATAIALTGDDGGGGLVGHLMGMFTGLATMTGWLYTGTLLAAGIVGVRALRRSWRHRRSQRCSADPRGRYRR